MSFLSAAWDWLGREPAERAPRERKVKDPYPLRFNFLLAVLLIIGAVAVSSFLVKVAITGTHVVTKTVQVDRPLTSAADLRESLGSPTQSVAGSDMGVDLATCDIWQGKTDLTVVCHN